VALVSWSVFSPVSGFKMVICVKYLRILVGDAFYLIPRPFFFPKFFINRNGPVTFFLSPSFVPRLCFSF